MIYRWIRIARPILLFLIFIVSTTKHLMSVDLNTIIRKVQQGDSAAFGRLVDRFQSYAFSLAFRILCDEDEAKDTVQESFLKIWEKRKTFDPSRKFTTWMYTIVTNAALDHLRVMKRRTFVKIEDVVGEIGHDALNRQMDNQEMSKLIRLLSEELPEKQRLVFVLRDLQGLDSGETQEILNETDVFVKSNLYLARKMIKEKLNKIMEFERRE